jgi:hypothetical protein
MALVSTPAVVPALGSVSPLSSTFRVSVSSSPLTVSRAPMPLTVVL